MSPFNKPPIFLVLFTWLLTPIAEGQAAIDLIECKREKVDSRQFCYIKANSFVVANKISKQKIFNDQIFEIGSIIQNGSMSIEAPDGTIKPLILSGLEPTLKFQADWSQNQDCLRNSLWTHNIFFHAKVGDNNIPLSKINIGLNSYSTNLNNISTGGLSAWSLSEVANEVQISSTISFVDSDFQAKAPLPQEKVDSICKLTIHGLALSYDARSISKDLATLKVMANDKVSLLAQSSIIHANLIDSSQGAKCAVYGLGTTLRDVEIIGEDEPWEKLSLTSQEAIKSALRKTQNLGGISSTLLDDNALWLHFTSETTQAAYKLSCKSKSLLDYKVSSEPFLEGETVKNPAGMKNVRDFEREVENLREIMNAAWALAEASRLELVQNENTKWLTDNGIYIHFPKVEE